VDGTGGIAVNLPSHIANAPTPMTDENSYHVTTGEVVLANHSRNLERIIIWQQEVMEKMENELQNIKDEHHKTMREVTDIGYSDGLCLKPSMFLDLLKAQSAYTQLKQALDDMTEAERLKTKYSLPTVNPKPKHPEPSWKK
jgi:hypothetical protein